VSDPELIWRLGRWIGRRESGAAQLAWGDQELILRIHVGKIVSIEGLDPNALAQRLECEPLGNKDLLEEARSLAKVRDVAETQAVGTAKEMLQEAIHEWLLASNRGLELVDGEPDLAEGPNISITHAIVELVLADTERNVYRSILPDLGVLLRRSGNFLDLYAPLRLSEDADLIVAKITGQRTADEIASRSPHEKLDVLRLLSALVATGMLEPIPVVVPSEEVELMPEPDAVGPPQARRLPVGWILAVGLVLVIIIAAAGYFFTRGGQSEPVQEDPGRWAIVVDMGCEPQDLQRVLKKANEHPKDLRAIRTAIDEGDECWRLVWGEFSSQAEAEGEIGSVPNGMRRDGFDPHVVELPTAEESAGDDSPAT
jgi:hypothetical protein